MNEPAPDISLTRADGTSVKLKELLGQKTVVLYFYPKDDTPGCTAEACSFRDSYEDFKKAGADVIGVSADDAGSHEAFKQKTAYEICSGDWSSDVCSSDLCSRWASTRS
jgi:peroxiredoxin Q/BCP